MRSILIGMALSAMVACGAQAGGGAQFGVYSVDLGGFPNTKGSPIGVSGGTFFTTTITIASTHWLFVDAGLGIAGWGTTFAGIESDAPTMEPFTNEALDLVNKNGTYTPAAPINAASATGFGGAWVHAYGLSSGVMNGTTPGGRAGVWIARLGLTNGATIDLTSTVARVGIREYASGPSGGDQVTMIDVVEGGSHLNASVEDALPRISYDFALYTVPENHPDYEVWDLFIEGTVLHTCDGDNNFDGAVDVNDISMVLFRLGNAGPEGGQLQGDSNGNGIVDVNDISYILWRMGDPCGAAIQLGDPALGTPCIESEFNGCAADLNGDCEIDVDDLALVYHFGGTQRGDANGDGMGDRNDISFILHRTGDFCTP